MASISRDPKGNRTIQFVAGDGKRRSIRLGKIPLRVVNDIKGRVQTLNACAVAKVGWDTDTAEWVGTLAPTLYDKLANAGLLPKRGEREKALLGAFIDRYIEKRTEVKPGSKEVWRQGKVSLVEFFGVNRPLVDITPGLADDYKLYLLSVKAKSRKRRDGAPAPERKLSSMTVRKRLQFAKMIFRAAVRHRLISADPFTDVGIKASMPDRSRFITPEETAKLLESCPGQDWRLIVTLARWGGMRCPSEVMSLTWADINWADETVLVTAPKTEHHPGKGIRRMPLFPEMRAELERAFHAAPEGAVYVVNERFRNAAMGPLGWRNGNLQGPFKKIILRSGLTPWPRLFHNLRSSRQTELSEEFPSHVVCAWLGNSPEIARDHYLQVTDEHFARACNKAVHNPVQQDAALSRNDQQPKQATSHNFREMQEVASASEDTVGWGRIVLWRGSDANCRDTLPN